MARRQPENGIVDDVPASEAQYNGPSVGGFYGIDLTVEMEKVRDNVERELDEDE